MMVQDEKRNELRSVGYLSIYNQKKVSNFRNQKKKKKDEPSQLEPNQSLRLLQKKPSRGDIFDPASILSLRTFSKIQTFNFVAKDTFLCNTLHITMHACTCS